MEGGQRDPPPAPSRSRPRPHLPRLAQSRPQGGDRNGPGPAPRGSRGSPAVQNSVRGRGEPRVPVHHCPPPSLCHRQPLRRPIEPHARGGRLQSVGRAVTGRVRANDVGAQGDQPKCGRPFVPDLKISPPLPRGPAPHLREVAGHCVGGGREREASTHTDPPSRPARASVPSGTRAGVHMHPRSPQWGRWPCLQSHKSPLLRAHKSGPDRFSSRPFGLIEGSLLNFQMAQEIRGWGAPPGKGVTTGLPPPSAKTSISAQGSVRSGKWELSSFVGEEAKKTHVY